MLITFEGIEGSGKSTQIKLLEKFFIDRGEDVILLREPGSTNLGEEIRNILLNSSNDISNNTELLLMFAARAQLIDQIIRKNLNKIILIDRYFHASIAYQGFGRGIDLEKIDKLKNVTECVDPDYTFLLDISPEDGFKRKSGDQMDRIESSGMEFFNRVRDGYLTIADQHDYMHVISSMQSPEDIHHQIVSIINES